jgi:hypothetical protein
MAGRQCMMHAGMKDWPRRCAAKRNRPQNGALTTEPIVTTLGAGVSRRTWPTPLNGHPAPAYPPAHEGGWAAVPGMRRKGDTVAG